LCCQRLERFACKRGQLGDDGCGCYFNEISQPEDKLTEYDRSRYTLIIQQDDSLLEIAEHQGNF
jgi:hypothetical protein